MRFAAGLSIVLILLSAPVWAQQTTGRLTGQALDPNDDPLPGVTVTVASEALLGGERSQITDAQGRFRFTQLPVGTYTVSFELQGFQTQVYEGIEVQSGTTFTLNANLTLGQVEETVTVTGESPVVDTGDTEIGFNFTKDIMDNVPNARDAWALVGQVPGVATSSINVGGTNTGNQLSFTGFGVDERQNTYYLNGANVTDNTNNGGSQFYFDVDSFAEVNVRTSSHSAEVQTPGMALNIVPQSGGNEFHGSGSLYYDNRDTQWNNVDDDLRALGVDRASSLNEYYDVGATFGGPIIPQELFFYGAYRRQIVEKFVTGTRNPDGSFPIDRTELWFPTASTNWQITPDHRLSFYFNMAQKKRFKRALSRLRPVETTWDQQGAPIARLFSFNHDWIASENLLVTGKVNVMDQGFELISREGVDTSNTPARLDLATGQWSDAPPLEFGIGKDLRHVGASVSYYTSDWAGGSHDFKFGANYEDFNQFGNQRGGVAKITFPADHRLLFFDGEPLEVMQFAPDASSVSHPTADAYVQDSYQVGNVLLNLGVRWDYQVNKLDEVTAPPSRFFEPITQEATENLIEWNDLAPRIGVVYDVFGDAQTLVKASYNRYHWQLWTEKGDQASAAGSRQARFVWNDLNGDRSFQEGEAGELLSINDPAANRVTIDPDLATERTDEFTVGVTQVLIPNLSVTASYIYRQDENLTWKINRAISPADFTPITAGDPGPDGEFGTADDGGTLTFFELAADKVGLSPNFIGTRPNFTREYNGFHFTAHRRMANNWQLTGSLSINSKTEQFGPGSFQNPQDIEQMDGTRISDSIPWIAKAMGSYRFPFGLMVSGFYQLRSGEPFTRTVNSSSALGRALNQGNVTALAGERNAETYDELNIVDLRASYRYPFRGVDLEFQFDAFNVLNVNTVTDDIRLSGSAFGSVLDFIPPRIVRFGVKATF